MSEIEATQQQPARRLKRWHKVVLGILVALVLFVLLFDWNWLRGPVERYVSQRTGREFRISHLDVDLGWNPTIKLRDVYFANADWSRTGEPMARIASLEFSVSLRDLWDHKILVPRAALSKPELIFERASDGRRNWVLKPPEKSAEPGTMRISSISVDQGRLRYFDHGEPLDVEILASTFAPEVSAKVTDAKAQADNSKYTTRYSFSGKYHGAGFSGHALTGDVLSFQESDIAFPIKGDLKAGTTKASVEGTVADVINISAIDVNLKIEGQTLATLYPFLLLPLPASPPYAFSGHLVQKGDRYGIDDLAGKIGSTDVRGSGAYVRKEPRPLLTGKLESNLLDIADLGPIIGLETKDTKATSVATKGDVQPKAADTETRAQAQAKERNTSGDKVLPVGTAARSGDGILPSGKFEGGRLKAIDAEIDYAAAKLKAPKGLAVENMKFSFRLHDAVAKLTPLEFGFSGGRIVSDITIDARQEGALRSVLNADFRNIKIARLFPSLPDIAQGVGEIGAQIRLRGTGNSIADAAGSANGSVTAAVSKGRVSNLLDAMVGLNFGKVIPLFVGGDKDIAVNCGGVAFDVKNGIGKSQLFVIDTAQTRIEGAGTFDLKDERFNLTITPLPKNPGILSLRTPVHLYGTFRHPEFSLDKKQLLLRAGGAVALALVNPLAALLPLIETGPGVDTDCVRLLAPVQGAKQQANATGNAAPKEVPKVAVPQSATQPAPKSAKPAPESSSKSAPGATPKRSPVRRGPQSDNRS
ncbi:MAG: AsmA family protein [Burkholderiaceae bacterium]